jgi:S-phase kinase-associated protein 1
LISDTIGGVVQEWYANYMGTDMQQDYLFELILAANYLDIQPLLDLTCATMATRLKGKKPSEIRQIFNIPNDFTPEDDAYFRDENNWYED